MTQLGFAGNLRYVALPAALVCVLAGAGWVDLVRARTRASARRRHRASAVLMLAVAAPYRGLPRPPARPRPVDVEAEADLYGSVPEAIAAGGGRETL